MFPYELCYLHSHGLYFSNVLKQAIIELWIYISTQSLIYGQHMYLLWGKECCCGEHVTKGLEDNGQTSSKWRILDNQFRQTVQLHHEVTNLNSHGVGIRIVLPLKPLHVELCWSIVFSPNGSRDFYSKTQTMEETQIAWHLTKGQCWQSLYSGD